MKRSVDFELARFGECLVARIGCEALFLAALSGSFAACAVTRGIAPVAAVASEKPSGVDAAKLLDRMNAAMAALDNVRVTGQIVHTDKKTDTIAGYEEYEAHGRFAPNGTLQATVTCVAITPWRTVPSMTFEYRRVAGVTYVNNGAWKIDPEAWTDDAFDKALSGRLALTEVTATEEVLDNDPVYRLVGRVPDDPSVERMELWVGVRNPLIRKLRITENDDSDGPETHTFNVIGTNEPLEVFAPQIAAPLPPVMTPVGAMATYRSSALPATILYPAEYEERPILTDEMTAWFAGENGPHLFIAEENLSEGGLAGTMTLNEYVDLTIAAIATQDETRFELVSREARVTAQGLPVEIVEFTAYSVFRYVRLIYLHEGRIGFNATYMLAKNRSDELMPVIEVSLNSFRVNDGATTPPQQEVERVPAQMGYWLSASTESRSPSL